MKITRWPCRVLRALTTCLVLTPWVSGAQSTPSAPDREALQRRMLRWVMPGEEHAQLARLAGDWEVTTALPGAPGRPPTVMTGRATARMTVGDRFLMIESRASGGSQSIDALTILGFDGRRDEYTYLGHDSFGTYYVEASGKGALSSGRLELVGIDRESATSTKHFTVRLELRGPEAFSQAILFQAPNGGTFTVLESEFRRVR